MMKKHADVLGMAKTEEKRERVKWFVARSVFFDEPSSFADGLALAQRCNHADARFFASLFAHGAPDSKEEAASVFLSQGSEPRCLCWAAVVGASPPVELLKRAAEGGDAWGQAQFGMGQEGEERKGWLQQAVNRGDRDGMSWLASVLWEGLESETDRDQAKALWLQAAELGCYYAQCCVADHCFPRSSLKWLKWNRIAGSARQLQQMLRVLDLVLAEFDIGCSGRKVFEIGAALAKFDGWEELCYGRCEPCRRAISLHNKWCGEAERANLCWLWLSRTLGVPKDIRVLIAGLVWDDRAVWSNGDS